MSNGSDGMKSGNGMTSPFGNGKGDVSSPVPASFGGNDFVTNPRGEGSPLPVRDLTVEGAPTQASPADSDLSQESVPAGGTNLPATLGDAAGVDHKPFKLNG